jgi:hypothetical protein
MPRFTTRTVHIAAHQFAGNTVDMPEAFRMAVRRHLNDGSIEVMTIDGLRPCRHTDWIVLGPSGTFSIWHAADFETFFADRAPEEEYVPKTTLSLRKKEPA